MSWRHTSEVKTWDRKQNLIFYQLSNSNFIYNVPISGLSYNILGNIVEWGNINVLYSMFRHVGVELSKQWWSVHVLLLLWCSATLFDSYVVEKKLAVDWLARRGMNLQYINVYWKQDANNWAKNTVVQCIYTIIFRLFVHPFVCHVIFVL